MANNIWQHGVADNDVNNPNNWSLNRVPIAGDVAYFRGDLPGEDDNCTFSGNLTCDGINVTSNYSGVVDLADKTYTLGSDGLVCDGTGEFNCNTATVNVTGGPVDIVDQTTWTRGTSIIYLAGDCTINTGTTNRLYDLYVSSGTSTLVTNTGRVYNTLTLDGTLNCNGKTLYLDSTLIVYPTGSLTSSGTCILFYSGAGEGITTFLGTIDVTNLRIDQPAATAVFRPGNYQSNVRVRNTTGVARVLTLDAAGAYQFGSLEFETTSTGSLTLANDTNGPASITIDGDLTFDKNSTGEIIINGSGQATVWVIKGDVVDQGAATWTKGNGTITASLAASQD